MHTKNNYLTVNIARLLLTFFLLESCGNTNNYPFPSEIKVKLEAPEEMISKEAEADKRIETASSQSFVLASLSEDGIDTIAHFSSLSVKKETIQSIDKVGNISTSKKHHSPVDIAEQIASKAKEEPQQIDRFDSNESTYMDVEKLYEEAKKGDATAKDEIIKRAHQGEAAAQNSLADMHIKGLGVEKNYIKAIEWAEKAAHQGHQKATCYLIATLINGNDHIKPHIAKAIYWSSKLKTLEQASIPISVDPPLHNSLTSQENEQIENFQAQLLENWQKKCQQKSHNRTEQSSMFHENSYLELYNIMVKLADWRNDLNTKIGILINNCSFGCPIDPLNINGHYAESSMILHAKEYEIKDVNYTSFGKENAHISDEIIKEVSYRAKYDEAIKIIGDLQRAYQLAADKATSKSLTATTTLDLLKTKPELQTDQSISILKKKLAIANELYPIFKKKLEDLEKEKSIFDMYYCLFLQSITMANDRNEVFKKELRLCFSC